MAAAAVAAHTLGFDGIDGCLISDPTLTDYHVVQVRVEGRPAVSNGPSLTVDTTRRNPATRGRVTGSATLNSFLSSVLRAGGQGPGIHLC